MKVSKEEPAFVEVVVQIPRERFTTTAPRPLLATNANSAATLGLPRRTFLRLLPELERAGIQIIREGKLRACLLADIERWLRARPVAVKPAPATNDAADEIAAELGLRATGSR